MSEPCVIARHINEISLNGYEYILNDDSEPLVSPDKNRAVSFLINNGATDEQIDYMRFLNYSKLQNEIYEDVS